MIPIGKVGKIIISKEAKSQIDYYHDNYPGNEWSGILFYKQTKSEGLKETYLVFVFLKKKFPPRIVFLEYNSLCSS